MPKHRPSQSNEQKSNEWQAFYDELQQESERGAVLVGAAFLDEHLRQLLQAFLADHKVSKELLESTSQNAPLGNFSARIDMAFALGLISTDMRNDLHVIRHIRNEFAHSLQGLTLDNEWVVAECLKLTWPQMLGEYSNFWNSIGPGDRLLLSISIHANRLKLTTLSVEKERRKIRPGEKIGQYIKVGDSKEDADT